MADVEHIEAAVGEDDALAALLVTCKQGLKLRRERILACDERMAQDGVSSGRFAMNGGEEFGARHGGGAALHHHQAAGDVGDVRGFERGGAGGEGQGVGCEDGVACAGDVDGLIAAKDGNVRRVAAASKRAMPWRPRVTSSDSSFMAARVARPLLASAERFWPMVVWCCSSSSASLGVAAVNARAAVFVEVVSRVESHGQ